MEKSGLRTAAKPLGGPIFFENALFLLKKHEIAAFVVVDKSGYFYGGEGGIRTLDLTDANRTLSQLSYAPMRERL